MAALLILIIERCRLTLGWARKMDNLEFFSIIFPSVLIIGELHGHLASITLSNLAFNHAFNKFTNN